MCLLHIIDGNSSAPCSHFSLIPSQALVKHCSASSPWVKEDTRSYAETFSHHSGFAPSASYLEDIEVDETLL